MPITVPNQGDPTKLSTIAAIIAELESIGADASTAIDNSSIVNGSFEFDSDANGVPDGWTRTLQTAGAFVLDITSAHGAYAAKFTSIGGGGNGGGDLTSDDFFEVTPQRFLALRWQLKSSAAGVKNIVAVRWYSDSDESDYISTTTLWMDTATNPSSFKTFGGGAFPPSTARFAKVVLTGCDSASSTAGSTWFDDVRIVDQLFLDSVELTGSGNWVAPDGVFFIYVDAIGGGGGGGGSGPSTGGGGGGGSGSRARSYVPVVPGTSYAYARGGGGAGGANNDGTNGVNTTFNVTTVIAPGGGGGDADAGAAGAAGAAATGETTTTGNAGVAKSGNNGGNGGASVYNAGAGAGGASGVNGGDATGKGAGGGGAGMTNRPGGDGEDGYLKIYF